MNLQWNIDLTAPPLKSKTQQSKIKQVCDEGDYEKDDEDDEKFGCSASANKEEKQATFLPGSLNKKFKLEMELKAMVQSFRDAERSGFVFVRTLKENTARVSGPFWAVM